VQCPCSAVDPVVLTGSSFFGDQEGDFSLTIKSIKAVCLPGDVELRAALDGFRGSEVRGWCPW
jgi:hypothetical protein